MGPPPTATAAPPGLTAEGRVRLLLEIARGSRRTLDLGETLNHLLDTLRSVLAYDAAGIFVLSESLDRGSRTHGGVIAGVARRGFPDRPPAEDAMLSSGQGLVGRAIRTGQGAIVADVGTDPFYVAGRDGTRAEIVVPILIEDRAIGALNLESDRLGAYGEADLEVLSFFADAAAMAIEKAMLHRHLLEKEQLERQLELGREVQARLLPQAAPELPGWEIAGLCQPSLQLGGDYFDYLPRADGRLGLVIADVAGKDVAAALIMATFRALLRAELEGTRSLPEALNAVGRLLRASAGTRAFVTCFFGLLNPTSGRLDYVNAGHLPPLLRRADGGVVELASTGPALGVFTEAGHGERQATLAPGDALLLHTDGLIEAMSPGGEQLGLERLVAGLAAPGAATDVIAGLVGAARAFCGSPHLQDDVTLMLLRRVP